MTHANQHDAFFDLLEWNEGMPSRELWQFLETGRMEDGLKQYLEAVRCR